MPSDAPKNAQREQTDRSLRDDREASARKSMEDMISVDETADAVISRARARADEVLVAARALTDLRRSPLGSTEPLRSSVAWERQREDATASEERLVADAVLRQEREASLAPRGAAREHTDQELLAERALNDAATVRREEYLGVVGHELRNMLSAVDGFASFLESAAERTGQREQLLHAQLIQRAGARMNRLIGDLVDVASIHAGTLKAVPERLDPAQVAQVAVDN